MKLITKALAVIILATVVGCGPEVQVTSDTSWTGVVQKTGSAKTVSGSGNATFEGYDCAIIQKRTSEGFVQVRVKYRGVPLLSKGSVVDRTIAPYGLAEVCNGGAGPETRERTRVDP